MSLKAIHIVFITASTLLAIGFGAWSLNNYFQGLGTRADLWMGIVSIGAALALVCYGVYFLKKLRNVSYL
ncbi:MAG: hypothetical protein FJ398_02680 [Verrucomicrobia bacterium]|nr:hypothetical protein [Verrucomicrobiota bacterium]